MEVETQIELDHVGSEKILTRVFQGDCLEVLSVPPKEFAPFDLTFLDPPFNQGKKYDGHDDRMPDPDYWRWMRTVCRRAWELSSNGAAIYFMQREKNIENVIRVLRETGWCFQNLIIWKKKTSAIPGANRFGKAFQVIAYATKGKRPRVFNRLRIDPPLLQGYEPRLDGVFVTDIWDDIRELTSGYYAGDEVLRTEDGGRLHKQQSPIALLLRIVLSSSNRGDSVLDPFTGTGTTLRVASQLGRRSLGIEKSEHNARRVCERLSKLRKSDDISRFITEYRYTTNLDTIWGNVAEDQNYLIDSTGGQYSMSV